MKTIWVDNWVSSYYHAILVWKFVTPYLSGWLNIWMWMSSIFLTIRIKTKCDNISGLEKPVQDIHWRLLVYTLHKCCPLILSVLTPISLNFIFLTYSLVISYRQNFAYMMPIVKDIISILVRMRLMSHFHLPMMLYFFSMPTYTNYSIVLSVLWSVTMVMWTHLRVEKIILALAFLYSIKIHIATLLV